MADDLAHRPAAMTATAGARTANTLMADTDGTYTGVASTRYKEAGASRGEGMEFEGNRGVIEIC